MVAVDVALVRRLVDTQFPQWADLPLRLVDPAGSDHAIYRLGEDLAVRIPRHTGAIGQAAKELEWLPRLAPLLPLAIPVPVAVGQSDFGYPWPWAVARWLPGEVATFEAFGESVGMAGQLAGFLFALQRVPTADAPPESGPELPARDAATRKAIAEVDGTFDGAAMTAIWDAALQAPGWNRPPVWFHGDFHTGNLLTVDGRLHAVIDFGGLGMGDPARDLMMAYTLMSPRPRAAFRAALDLDDDTWTRGRGWALATGLNAYTSYAAVNPDVARRTTRQITQALIG